MDASVARGAVGLSEFAAPRPAYDEYTGVELPAHLASKAREEEVAMVGDWGICGVIARAEAFRLTGTAPFKGRWVDCKKSDRGQ
eukprot:1130001-Alexandrium_andersonii.AAC.1